LAGERGEHVALRDTTRLAGAFDAGGIEAGLGRKPADGRGDFGGGSGFGRDWGGLRRGHRSRGRGCLGGDRGGGRRSIAGGTGLDRSHDLADDDFGAGRDRDGDLAVDFGGAFRGHLVGFVGKEGLALAHGVTAFDQPGGQQAPGDGFAHGRDFDFDGHEN
jgi:hypothetical protein